VSTAAVPLRSGVPGSEPQSPLKAWTRWVSRCREGARFWLISRMAFFLAAYVVVLVGDNITGKGNVPPHTFLSSWMVWDGVYYLHIAQFGYVDYGNAVFFPLYPLLIRVAAVGTQQWVLAALVVSALATLATCIGLVALLRFEGWHARTRDAALRAVFAYPFAFILGTILSEPLFLACVVWTIYCARRGWWLRAALTGLLAGLARPTALALIPVLAWEGVRQTGLTDGRGMAVRSLWERRALPLPHLAISWQRVRVTCSVICAVAGAPLGFVLFLVYCGRHYGDPLAMVHAQASWGHKALPPWTAFTGNIAWFFWQLQHHPWQYDELRTVSETGSLLLVLLVTLLGAYGVGMGRRDGRRTRIPLAYTLFSLALVGTVILSPQVTGPNNRFVLFGSAYRYMLIAFPAWVTIGYWMSSRRWLDQFWTTTGLLLQAALLALFLLGGYPGFIG